MPARRVPGLQVEPPEEVGTPPAAGNTPLNGDVT